MTTLLAAADLHRAYGPTPALAGANFRIAAGEIVALMGPSGSGKSTLLHCLSGIVRPDSGQVTYRDHELSTMSDSERSALRRTEFGFVFGVLLTLVTLPLQLDWTVLAGITGGAAAVVILVTLASLPALWRLMRPDGLRTE